MASRRKSTRKRKAPNAADGQVRASQSVTTYGPGSLVDLLHESVIIRDPSRWSYRLAGQDTSKSHEIREDRLKASLAGRHEFFKPGSRTGFRSPPITSDEITAGFGIHARRFPNHVVCTNPQCRQLLTYQALDEKTLQHDCTKAGASVVPVRFVTACANGHLSEFPWRFFVHQEGERCSKHVPLKLLEGSTGDVADLVVHCTGCNQKRRLSEARSEQAGLSRTCFGDRPWVGGKDSSEAGCQEPMRLLVRTASNAYFSAVESALSIPENTSELHKRLVAFAAQNGMAPTDIVEAYIPLIRATDKGEAFPVARWSDDAMSAAIRDLKSKKGKHVGGADIRIAEHRTFMSVGSGGRDKITTDGDESGVSPTFSARRAYDEHVPAGLDRVIKLDKVREVRALVGFSRLKAPTRELQGQVGGNERLQPANADGTWLPASEVHGEGIFIELDHDRLDAWHQRPEVEAREAELRAGFDAAHADGLTATGTFPGIRFYLLHSLAHALIQELSFSCGYAASALRERIYCGIADGYEMYGLLISTGSPGSGGTLGGLVAQADQLSEVLSDALYTAKICSNDPVCAAHEPKNDRSTAALDGAACHGCMYIAESSCEWFNKQLDRALLVPAMSQAAALAYFDADEL